MIRALTNKDEHRVHVAQRQWITQHCGADAAHAAHYGCNTGNFSVTTQVYLHGVLQSYIIKLHNKRSQVRHTFDAYAAADTL